MSKSEFLYHQWMQLDNGNYVCEQVLPFSGPHTAERCHGCGLQITKQGYQQNMEELRRDSIPSESHQRV